MVFNTATPLTDTILCEAGLHDCMTSEQTQQSMLHLPYLNAYNCLWSNVSLLTCLDLLHTELSVTMAKGLTISSKSTQLPMWIRNDLHQPLHSNQVLIADLRLGPCR